MALLVYGPPGVGKSSALTFVARSLSKCRFVAFDHLARDSGLIRRSEGVNDLRNRARDDDVFLRIGTDAVERLELQERGLC